MRRSICLNLILILFLLCLAPVSSAASYAPIALTDEERAAANLFLSNFTEIGLDHLNDYDGDMALVDFAHDHLWFNDHDSFEYGEYLNDNNCRVSDDRIQEIIDRYFYDPRPVDLSQTRFDYIDGYYYHCETGGWTPCGFAHVVSICPTAEIGVYFVSFLIFGGGDAWDNSVMDDTLADIESAYHYPSGYGSALIHADDLSDRSTYKLVSYSSL